MHEALFYHRRPKGVIICELCPHNCKISIGKAGVCRVRRNVEGKLFAENYGKLTAIHSDPIEKKPFYHFYPGRNILSIGSIGCNLKCSFCQNCEISQSEAADFPDLKVYTPGDIVELALSTKDNLGLAYTYNEPTVFYEFILDTSRLIKDAGLKNVIVTNGYINNKPLEELIQFADAFNVDLKAFDEVFFKKYTQSQLKPVLETLLQIRESGKHLEITNLVIPGLNDDPVSFRKMVKWIATELGSNTIVHLSRYFPRYKLSTESTSVQSLLALASVAREYLLYVYVGNVDIPDQQNTFCHNCRSLVISRSGYSVRIIGLLPDGSCASCNTKIVFT
jgi:pyruvate formate lyase activating enzyme